MVFTPYVSLTILNALHSVCQHIQFYIIIYFQSVSSPQKEAPSFKELLPLPSSQPLATTSLLCLAVDLFSFT